MCIRDRIGADYLIEGGQTMNPSTEDMLNAIKKVNADHIFILPNNKNIILSLIHIFQGRHAQKARLLFLKKSWLAPTDEL